MTKERMQDLLSAFREQGWDLETINDLYLVENDEVIRWNLIREQSGSNIQLEFHLFSDLGRRSENLKDILYCKCQGQTLYFEKRQSVLWEKSLRDFVLLFH